MQRPGVDLARLIGFLRQVPAFSVYATVFPTTFNDVFVVLGVSLDEFDIDLPRAIRVICQHPYWYEFGEFDCYQRGPRATFITADFVMRNCFAICVHVILFSRICRMSCWSDARAASPCACSR